MPVHRPPDASAAPKTVIHVNVSTREKDLLLAAAARGPGRPLSLSRFLAEAGLAAAGAAPRRPPSGRAPSRLLLAELMEATVAVHRAADGLAGSARGGPADPAVERTLAALERLGEVARRTGGTR